MRASGERHGNAKLTREQALAIRGSKAPGSKLAAQYGCSESTICNIRRGRTWAHSQDTAGTPAVTRGAAQTHNESSGATQTGCAAFPVASDPFDEYGEGSEDVDDG